MNITEKDLGFTLVDIRENCNTAQWCIIDFKICKANKENYLLSVALERKSDKDILLDELKSDYIEYIKPYFIKIIEDWNNKGHYYSDNIDVIYDVPEENILYWKLKYQ